MNAGKTALKLEIVVDAPSDYGKQGEIEPEVEEAAARKGSVITVAMGFLRVKLIYAMAAVAVGKYLRYWLLIQAWVAV